MVTLNPYSSFLVMNTHSACKKCGRLLPNCRCIINRYHPLLKMESASMKFTQKMLDRAKEPNVIQAFEEVENLPNRNANRWLRLNELKLNDFPISNIEFLRNLTFSTYQIKLAPSYVQDKIHRENDEVFEVEILRDDNSLSQTGFLKMRVRLDANYQIDLNMTPDADFTFL